MSRSLGPQSLLQYANNEVLRQLSRTIKGPEPLATFTCGGTVDLLSFSKSSGVDEINISAHHPIHIIWESEDGVMRKIQFPLRPDEESALFLLVHGFDVAENTSKPGSSKHNVAASRFVTDFHPFDYGITDAIRQVLVPDAKIKPAEAQIETPSLKTELQYLSVSFPSRI